MTTKAPATTEADALLRRYYEQHGTWRDEVHRTGDGRTVEVHTLVPCDCALCADARVYLKVEA